MQRGAFSAWTVVLLAFSATALLAGVIFFVLPLPELLWPGTIGSLLARAAIIVFTPIIALLLLGVLATSVHARGRRRDADIDRLITSKEPTGALHLRLDDARPGASDDSLFDVAEQLWVVAQVHSDDGRIVEACARRVGDLLCSPRSTGDVIDGCSSVLRESLLSDRRDLVGLFAQAAARGATDAATRQVRDLMLSFIQENRTAGRGVVQRAYEKCFNILPFDAKARAVALVAESSPEQHQTSASADENAADERGGEEDGVEHVHSHLDDDRVTDDVASTPRPMPR